MCSKTSKNVGMVALGIAIGAGIYTIIKNRKQIRKELNPIETKFKEKMEEGKKSIRKKIGR